MAWKLIYTSAPRLLQAGRSGFGTVARHRDIPPLVAETAEKSSQFSRQTGLDPARVIFSYRVARSSAGNFHLFTRISDAGTDYSGRTNHLAEHLILTEQEAARLGAEGYTPAGTMLAYEWSGYEGQTRWLGDEDLWCPNATDANTGGSHWEAATADAKRVNLLASAEAQSGAVLEYPSHYQTEAHPWILWLFAESQCLCPQSGWGITFTTNVQPTDSLSDFRWLGMPDNSPVLHKLQSSGRPLFNFATETPKTFVRRPDAQQPALALPSTHEGTVRSSKGSTRGLSGVISTPPPKTPIAVEKRRKSFNPLYLLFLVVPISAALIWWRLAPDAPHQPATERYEVPEQVSATEPIVTSSPPPKAPETVIEPTSNQQTTAYEAKLIDTKKTSEPASVSPSDSTLEQTPIAPAAPRMRPAHSIILFPDSWGSWMRSQWGEEGIKKITWSAKTFQLAMIDKSGSKQVLKAPEPFQKEEKFYETDSGVRVFGVSGKNLLPSERVKQDAWLFEISKNEKADEIWRVYILPFDKSLQSVVPEDDPLMLGKFVIVAGADSSFLKFDTPDVAFAEFISYLRDQSGTADGASSPSLVLEASYSPPSEIQSARGQEIAPGQVMIDKATADSIKRIRIPIDDKGQLILGEAKKPFDRLQEKMKMISDSASNEPSDILTDIRGSLLTSLGQIDKATEGKKSSNTTQALRPEIKLSEVPSNLKSEAMESQLEKLADEYFHNLEILLPEGNPSKLKEHRDQALEHIRNKNYREAGKSAERFIAEKRQIPAQRSVRLMSEAKALGIALDLFAQRSTNAVTDDQKQLAKDVVKKLTERLYHLLNDTPQVPDFSYTLKIRRGTEAAGSEFAISEDIPVKRAEGSQSNQVP